MRISIMRGNQVICSSSDEQMTMEDVNAIKRKERMTDRKSTLSVYVYDPNKETEHNPIKIPEDKQEIIEKAKVIAAGGVPEEKTVVMDTMPEEVREAEEKAAAMEEIEDAIEDRSGVLEEVESEDEPTETVTSGYIAQEGDEVSEEDLPVTTVASTEVEGEVEEETEEPSTETTPTEFNVQSKFTQPTAEETVEESEDEDEEESEEESSVEEKTTEEVIHKPSASSKVIDDFFAKEAREEKLYGNKRNKNYKQQRGGKGKRGRIEEY